MWLVCCERGLHARGGGLRQFKLLGLVAINAPENARGKLDITYVDEDLRISRGDKGAVRLQHAGAWRAACPVGDGSLRISMGGHECQLLSQIFLKRTCSTVLHTRKR